MSQNEITIPTSYIETLLQRVSERGYDTELLLKQAGIQREELESGRYFSAVRFGRLYQHAISVMHDEWFGMLSGGKVHRGSFRLLSLLMVQCKTLRQSLIRAWQFGHVCRGFRVTLKLEEIGDTARISIAPLEHVEQQEFDELIGQSKPVLMRTTLATWQRHWSWLIGTEIKVLRSFYTFSKPEADWEMAQFSSDDIVFDHSFNGFEMPASYLDYSVIQTEETNEDFLRMAPFGLVINVEQEQTTKARIKAILNQNVGHAMLGAERVAERLNMSVTTLRRHLQHEGTSFQRLKDECRMEAAFHYLNCPELSNRDIADRLGFDEVSAFFRAFKKWTGLTPGQYRSTHPMPSPG